MKKSLSHDFWRWWALLAVHKKMASLASSATVGQGDKQKQQLIGRFRERAPLFITVLDKEQPCLIFLWCFLSYNLVDRKALTGFCVSFKHYNFFGLWFCPVVWIHQPLGVVVMETHGCTKVHLKFCVREMHNSLIHIQTELHKDGIITAGLWMIKHESMIWNKHIHNTVYLHITQICVCEHMNQCLYYSFFPDLESNLGLNHSFIFLLKGQMFPRRMLWISERDLLLTFQITYERCKNVTKDMNTSV